MKKFHFKHIPYKYNQKKVVMTSNDFRAMQDYILHLESFAHYATGKTFDNIPTELRKYKEGEWYKKFHNLFETRKRK